MYNGFLDFLGGPFSLVCFKMILLKVMMRYWLLFYDNNSAIEGIYGIIRLQSKILYYSLSSR